MTASMSAKKRGPLPGDLVNGNARLKIAANPRSHSCVASVKVHKIIISKIGDVILFDINGRLSVLMPNVDITRQLLYNITGYPL